MFYFILFYFKLVFIQHAAFVLLLHLNVVFI